MSPRDMVLAHHGNSVRTRRFTADFDKTLCISSSITSVVQMKSMDSPLQDSPANVMAANSDLPT